MANITPAERQRRYRERNPDKWKETNAAYRERNREKILAQRRAEYAANPEPFLKRSAAWKKANRDKVNARTRELMAANPELYREKGRQYREANRDRYLAYQREYTRTVRTAKRNAILLPMLEAQQGRCLMCKRPLDVKEAVLDHDHACCDVPVPRSCGRCVRGAIHDQCNKVLGMAADSPELLRRGADYLEEQALIVPREEQVH